VTSFLRLVEPTINEAALDSRPASADPRCSRRPDQRLSSSQLVSLREGDNYCGRCPRGVGFCCLASLKNVVLTNNRLMEESWRDPSDHNGKRSLHARAMTKLDGAGNINPMSRPMTAGMNRPKITLVPRVLVPPSLAASFLCGWTTAL